MRRLLALLLLLAAVSAQCMLSVDAVEVKYNATKDKPAVMCTQPDADLTLYADFAELAQEYQLAAECFYSTEFDDANAGNHYALAGEYYMRAAQSICGDYNLQASLYASAGDSYYDAFYVTEDGSHEALSKQAYSLALTTYQYHRSAVSSFTEATYTSKMRQFDSQFVSGLGDFEPEGDLTVVIIGVVAIIIFGIILIAFFIGKH